MSNHPMSSTTPAWVAQTWASFAISVTATLIGIYNLPTDVWVRSFLAMGVIFSVGASLSLAKTIRDGHEEKLRRRSHDARSEFEAELG